jgi:hypothetical protein
MNRSENTLEDFLPGDHVIYVPRHAYDNLEHPDCRRGEVSSVNGHCVFVKFDEQVQKLGWDGTTSQGCQPTDLHRILTEEKKFNSRLNKIL